MNIIEKARNLRQLIEEYAERADDKTLIIATNDYFKEWTPASYNVGDIRTKDGKPFECILAHDSAVNPTYDITVRTLWKPYHSRKKEFALPWEAPTGAHDMYLSGDFMVWNDGKTYQCMTDTNFNPADYPEAWELVE